MRYFAILHRPSGYYLPFVGRGATYAEPVNPAVEPPRLFTTRGAAKNALRWWLLGVTTVSRTGGSWDNGYEYDETWHTEPVEDRRAEDMGIVELHLIRG
jgi:hypothetical protein